MISTRNIGRTAASSAVLAAAAGFGARSGARSGFAGATPDSVFPLGLSANSRFLQTPGGTPFLLRGDTPWELVKLSPTDVATYLDDRQARGINAIVLEGPISPDFVASNYNGDVCFTGTTGGQSDISTPGANWFARVAAVVASAQSRGMAVIMFPLYLGFGGGNEGFMADLTASGSTKAATYGTFIGNLLKTYPNVIWALGGDYVPDATGLALVKVMADAIKAVDTIYSRLWTWHADPNTQSYEIDSVTAGYRASISSAFLNWEYSYETKLGNEFTSFNALNCYSSSPTTPVFLGEASYEFSSEQAADAKLLRRQHWGAMLSGGIGVFFGQEGGYNFQTGWQALLPSTGTAEKVYLDQFFASRAWQLLAPSTGSGFVSSGGGTSNTAGYKPRALASDGSWGAVYVADGSATTIDFSGFAASKNVYWFDPTTGVRGSSLGSHVNSGTQSYTPSGNNAAGANDWVLVIE